MSARLASLITLLASGLASSPAWACAVCRFGEEDPSLDAYFYSVILMSLIPIGLICGGLFYVYKRVQGSAETVPLNPSSDS